MKLLLKPVGNNVLVTLTKNKELSNMVETGIVEDVGELVSRISIGEQVVFYEFTGRLVDSKRSLLVIPEDQIIATIRMSTEPSEKSRD